MMKYLFTIFLLSSTLFAAAFDMVKSGKANASIVMPKHATPLVKLACDELIYHLQQSTGAVLPVISEDEINKSEYDNFIFLGNTLAAQEQGLLKELKGNSYRLLIQDNKFFICANAVQGKGVSWAYAPRGTLFGVYDFLENYLKMRWLWPGKTGEYIPKYENIKIDKVKASCPATRNIAWATGYYRRNPETSMVTDRFITEEKIFLQRQRVAAEENFQSTHNFIKYWDMYHKSNPEFFQLLPNGERGLLSKSQPPQYVGMCVSQPKLWETIIELWKTKKFRHYLEGATNREKIIAIGENDTPGFCVCEACRAWDNNDDPRFKKSAYWGKGIIPAYTDRFQEMIDRTGEQDDIPSLSDRYARFYLEVLKLGKKINPEMKVTGFAYANYLAPPVKVKLNQDVVITYTPAIYYPWTEKKRQRFQENFSGWRQAGATMVYRPNYNLSGHNMPLLFGHQAAKDIKFALENGMRQACFDSLLSQWGANAMNFYWIQRTLIYPERSSDDLLCEFAEAFGAASEDIEAYLRYWQKVADDFPAEKFDQYSDEEGGVTFKNWLSIADRIFTRPVMDKGFQLLDAAMGKAKNDPDALAKIEFLKSGLKHADLTVRTRQFWREYQKDFSEINKSKYVQSLQALYKYRQQLMSGNSSNIDYLIFREHATWDASFRHQTADAMQLPETWAFKADEFKVGEKEKWFAEKDFSKWNKIEIGKYYHQSSLFKEGDSTPEWAWHVLKFKTPDFAARRRVVLTFGAVDEGCEVWINGKHVLSRVYDAGKNANAWQEPFSIDVTGQLNSMGEENILTVKVVNKVLAGGIWKPVCLVPGTVPDAKNPIPNPGFED